MKKLGILFILIIGIAIAVGNKLPILQEDPEVPIDIYNKNEEKVAAASTDMAESRKLQISQDQVYEGNLVLVNQEYPVKEEAIRPDIVPIVQHAELLDGYAVMDGRVQLSKEVARRFVTMIAAAREDGVSHFIINSGFRGFDEQAELYEQKGSDYALPAGYSEHNLGLSVDVGSTQMKMERADEGKWLAEHAWKYGFVMRYPKNKSDITGIQYEPWHIRYVGLPHSAIMQKNDWVLEEYLDELKEQKKITAEVDGKKYEVSYFDYSRKLTIPIPADGEYELSGDNQGGIILTTY